MVFAEDDYLPISAVQRWAFCERQAALTHLECEWAENLYTVEGNRLHERTHAAGSETRPGVRTVRGLQVRCERLGLYGVCDVVEFIPPPGDAAAGEKTELDLEPVPSRPAAEADRPTSQFRSDRFRADLTGWTVRPVEYKRGKPKRNDCDRLQLTAQAICLEEMLRTPVHTGLIYYGVLRRRTLVVLDAVLRNRVEFGVARLREILREGRSPPPVEGPHCLKCSLHSICMPELGRRGSARAIWERRLKSIAGESE